MLRRPVPGLAGIIVLLCCAAVARAQEFRASTTIYDARKPGGAGAPASHPRGRSTSLFHAGRVYDQLDAGSQMTIFEPAHERFVIIDRASLQSAVLTFDDINRWIYQSAMRAKERIARERSQTPNAKQVELLEFQLEPKFKETYSEKDHILTLSSGVLTYEVKCATHDSQEVIDAYLDYADWAARLNFVVNPQALFPQPRLALNEALRRRHLLPVEVKFRSAHEKGMQLDAHHRFDWKLDDTDRRTIHDWNEQLQNRNIKQVSPEAFLAASASPTRR